MRCAASSEIIVNQSARGACFIDGVYRWCQVKVESSGGFCEWVGGFEVG